MLQTLASVMSPITIIRTLEVWTDGMKPKRGCVWQGSRHYGDSTETLSEHCRKSPEGIEGDEPAPPPVKFLREDTGYDD